MAQLAEQALPPATEVTGSNLHSGNLVEHLFAVKWADTLKEETFSCKLPRQLSTYHLKCNDTNGIHKVYFKYTLYL